MRRKFLKLAFLAACSGLIAISCEETITENQSIIENETDSSAEATNTSEIILDSSEFINITDPIDHDYDNNYSNRIFQNTDGTWGYEILDDSSIFIRQPNIPAISGTKGFSSEAKAISTADFVIYKLEAGFFPPSLSKAELDSLGVL